MIYIVRDLSGVIGTAQVDTKKLLGRGATAIVYPAELNGSSFAAKIYDSDKKLDIAKIEAMLANPPANVRIQFAGAQHSQLAWPSAILTPPAGRDLGYLMPLSDLSKSFSLDHYYDQTLLRKLKSPSEGALSFKLEIARNLCLLVADLHDHNHCFIDMKPQNIRVLLGSHVVTLLDCDGFSIAGADGKRYPAELLSSDYISPEAYRNKTLPSQLGEDQDRYALAVILFQLLNGGTHPFQGIINGSGITATTNDEKAAQGLYPHGVKPNPRITPRPQSIHFLLDDGMQALFNAAFIGCGNQRPAARDWAHLLDTLLRSKALTRCDKETFDLGHMRFKDKPCPACYLAGLKTVVVAKTNVKLPPIPPPIPVAVPSPAPAHNSPYQQTSSIPLKSKPKLSSFGLIVTFVLVATFSIYFYLGLSGRFDQKNVTNIPTVKLNAPAEPYVAACALDSLRAATFANLCTLFWQTGRSQCDPEIIKESVSRGRSLFEFPCNPNSGAPNIKPQIVYPIDDQGQPKEVVNPTPPASQTPVAILAKVNLVFGFLELDLSESTQIKQGQTLFVDVGSGRLPLVVDTISGKRVGAIPRAPIEQYKSGMKVYEASE